jgi:aminobenzoyl-glutamate transport protein
MNIKKIKAKITLHPIMSILFMTGFIIVLSSILSLLGIQATSKTISTTSLEYKTSIVEVTSLLSISGIKYIFTSTVEYFMNFAPLSSLIIILIGIGIMEKSGFLKTAFTLLTKNMKKNTVTFVLVLISILAGIIGDLSYIILIPLSAILFSYGKRNPILGIIASFAGLSCGSGINVFLTSVDSSLLSLTTLASHMVDANYTIETTSFIFIMFVAIIALSFIITAITERYVVYKLDKYEIPATNVQEEFAIGKKEKKGLFLALVAGAIYLLIFLYNIIPGLPLSGKLLDDSQVLFIDKLFSYNSFFTTGFVFIVTMYFIILGLFYGIGAKTIKNNRDLCEDLGHSLDGIGKILVLILFASILINVFKYTDIGTIIVTELANLINSLSFTGLPLIIALFIIAIISTIFVPSSITKWTLISGIIIPIFMKAGISPEFTQVIFRFGESVSMGLTPLFSYFVIYLAFLEKYNQGKKSINITKAIKYQLPYSILTFIVLLTILIVWYIVGLPIGIGSAAAL